MHSTKKNTSHLKTDAILTSEMDKVKKIVTNIRKKKHSNENKKFRI